MKQVTWAAPAEATPVCGCDCYWHHRIFSHIALGPIGTHDRQRLPLGRKVSRTDYEPGRIVWLMEMPIDGCLFTVGRLVYLDRVTFWATIGRPGGTPVNGGAVRLIPDNDHSRRPGGGDPTLIWRLPERIGRVGFPSGSNLIVWPEAWWWHLVDRSDGRSVDPLAEAESIGAVSDDDSPWPLRDSGWPGYLSGRQDV